MVFHPLCVALEAECLQSCPLQVAATGIPHSHFFFGERDVFFLDHSTVTFIGAAHCILQNVLWSIWMLEIRTLLLQAAHYFALAFYSHARIYSSTQLSPRVHYFRKKWVFVLCCLLYIVRLIRSLVFGFLIFLDLTADTLFFVCRCLMIFVEFWSWHRFGWPVRMRFVKQNWYSFRLGSGDVIKPSRKRTVTDSYYAGFVLHIAPHW